MRRLFLIAGLMTALGLAVVAASAFAPANFAGAWSLDKAKSQGLSQGMMNAESVTWTITQDDKQISIDSKVVAGAPPAIGPIHDRLSAGRVRVVDVGCGTGWSSIAIARAYPSARVDGFDPDEIAIQMARDHADEAGISDRVRFHREDAAELTRHGPFEVATAFECIHDMARPVEVLRAVREAIVDDGAMLIVDERTRDVFSGDPDDREAYFYGWSVFDCLPTGMYEQPSAGTGTVMRPSTLRRYADEAGFTRFDVLPIEHDAFRLYLLQP